MGDLSIREVAERLGVSVQAVHKRITNGTLQAQKVNGHWQVREEAVAQAQECTRPAGRPRVGNDYLLMNGTYRVMLFSYDDRRQVFIPREVYDAARAPIGTVTRTGAPSAVGLARWWNHRSIPGARAGIDAKLAELGISDPTQLPFRNLGLSLSDQYWVCPADADLQWNELNYFHNDFGNEGQAWDEWLANVGLSSPDNTSEGVLPKKWVCEGRKRVLLKGHIPWTDQQVYNEVVATALQQRLLNAGEFVEYQVRHVEGLGVVSACKCFIAPDEEYVPASLIMDTEGVRKGELPYDALVRHARNLGIPQAEVELSLAKMVVCDSLLANTDCHLRNFGFIRNIDTLEWRMAPLFDSGNSLWYDQDESAVARNDHPYLSRPFDSNPNRQIMLVAPHPWFNLGLLDGFAEEAVAILEPGDISGWRLDYLAVGITKRIEALRALWG